MRHNNMRLLQSDSAFKGCITKKKKCQLLLILLLLLLKLKLSLYVTQLSGKFITTVFTVSSMYDYNSIETNADRFTYNH